MRNRRPTDTSNQGLSAPGKQQSTSGCDAILLVSNYSNRTGYAWRNIHQLFEEIIAFARSRGIASVVSFAEIRPPVESFTESPPDHIIQLPPAPKNLRELQRFLGAIRKFRIRYLYLTDHQLVSWRYPFYRSQGVRRIIVHSRVSVPDPNPAKPDRGLRGIAKALLARLPGPGVDSVYAVSDFVRQRIIGKNRFPSHRVHTILNGIDLEPFTFGLRASGRETIQICTTARATRHKGIQVLIEAARLLRDEYNCKDFRVEFAGDGPDMDYFRSLVAEAELEDRFIFLGEIKNPYGLLEASDIVVVPSVWGDACPSAVAEGLASGRALIATRVGGVPEQVGNEENAVLVPPNDARRLATALADLVRDPGTRARMGRDGRSRALSALAQGPYHEAVLERLEADLGLASFSDRRAQCNA